MLLSSKHLTKYLLAILEASGKLLPALVVNRSQNYLPLHAEKNSQKAISNGRYGRNEKCYVRNQVLNSTPTEIH